MGTQSEPLELSYARGPVRLTSVTGTAAEVRRDRLLKRGTRPHTVTEVRTGTQTRLAVVAQDGRTDVAFYADVETNIPVEDGNQVSAVLVSGPDGVNYVAMLVNHEERRAWFVGNARRIAIELGAAGPSPWWALLLRGAGLILLVFSFISFMVYKRVHYYFPPPLLSLVPGVACVGAGIVMPLRRLRDATGQLTAGAESFAERLLSNTPRGS